MRVVLLMVVCGLLIGVCCFGARSMSQVVGWLVGVRCLLHFVC